MSRTKLTEEERVPVTVKLLSRHVATIDRFARAEQMDRSTVLRQIVAAWIGQQRTNDETHG
jgi:ribbon-helix-helix CopG family protein